jgi:RNA polymerase sigma factor (sigma-70 family)
MKQHGNVTDEQILEWLATPTKVSAGIESLYHQHLEGLSHFVMSNGGSREEAADIFQEVMVTFVYNVQDGRFKRESSIKTYLHAINRNLWFNELKRRGRATARHEAYQGLQDGEHALSDSLEKKEARGQLMTIVDSLGETCKKILVLFYYEKKSMGEILSVLNYENEQVVRNKKYKCMKKLEELIEGRPGLREQLKSGLYG